jgi:hypothetical protein
MRVRLLTVIALCLSARPGAQAPAPDGPALLLERLGTVLAQSDAAAYRALLAPHFSDADRDALTAQTIVPGATAAVLRERDRFPLLETEAGGVGLVVEAFVERGDEASLHTYRLVARPLAGRPPPTPDELGWRIETQELVASIDGLFRLRLDPSKQFAATNLVISAEDFSLSVASGSVFVSETSSGATALVVLGDAVMQFTPRPEAEKGQLRLFCGADALVTPATAAFIRLNPVDVGRVLATDRLSATAVDTRDLARAQRIFNEHIGNSFALDLRDVSRDSWSLVPQIGDFLAEVQTRRFDTLSYARSNGEPEDITLFNRDKRRNISLYASQRKLELRGRTYNEDSLVEYDVLHYDIEAAFLPDAERLEATARVQVRVRSHSLGTLTLKLHEDLAVHSVVSEELGRILSIRVKGQNSLLLNLPKVMMRDDVLTFRVVYSGSIPPLQPDREVSAAGQRQLYAEDGPLIVPEARYVFSNRSYWYPQNTVTDFATARLRLTVPAPLVSVASGSPTGSGPRGLAGRPGEGTRHVSEFVAGQPLRYLSWAVSRFAPAASRVVTLPVRADRSHTSEDPGTNGHEIDRRRPAPGVSYDSLDLSIIANPRQMSRGRRLVASVDDIIGFYADLIGDLPYPSFTLALVDSDLPGGHSPAYFALLYQPLPTTPLVWRNDPVYFESFPQFFLAHELAHQYWGQAVGWKNYHEQWLSEGFAQYFATLYAEKQHPAVLRDVLRRMRRTVLDHTEEGPIALGYRLGHIRGESRVFRAIIYNKGALVLHMLRRLVGDDRFFASLRELYWSSRFTKIGTDDVRQVFERTTGRSLERFFERWVYDAVLPRYRWSWQVESGGEAAGAGVLRLQIDQAGDLEPFDVPVTVALRYRDGTTEDATLVLTELSSQVRVPLRGPLRDVALNPDDATLAVFEPR